MIMIYEFVFVVRNNLSVISFVGSGFFFSSRRRHTRCGRDWSSDVCSSDLATVEIDDVIPVEHYLGDRMIVFHRDLVVDLHGGMQGPRQRHVLDDRDVVLGGDFPDLERDRIDARSEERRVGKGCRSWWWEEC